MRGLHALRLAQVVPGPRVLLPGAATVAGFRVVVGGLGQLVDQAGPRVEQLTGAGVFAAGGGVAELAAGTVDLVDQSAAVQRGDDAQVPDVVAREVLEHVAPSAPNRRLVVAAHHVGD